jgi:hypothetical protein
MVEKKTTTKTTKQATVKKTATPALEKKSAKASPDKAADMYAKRNKASGLDLEIHPLAMWGFIASISPIVLVFIPFINFFTPFLPVAGIVLSILGLVKIKQQPTVYKGKGFAIAGIIIGSLMILLGLLAIIAFVAIFSSSMTAGGVLA